MYESTHDAIVTLLLLCSYWNR